MQVLLRSIAKILRVFGVAVINAHCRNHFIEIHKKICI
jgi:hypothetical protein